MNSNLKKVKYYVLSWSTDGFGGLIGRYATKKEAQEALQQHKKEDYARGQYSLEYSITEQNVLDLINHECEMAAIEERNNMYNEIHHKLSQKYQTEFEKAIEKEKKRLHKEMRKILKNWFEIEPDGNI